MGEKSQASFGLAIKVNALGTSKGKYFNLTKTNITRDFMSE